MAQNIYDNQDFFDGYAKLSRSEHGLDGAPEWQSIVKQLPKLEGLNIVDLGCGYGWFCRYARQQGAKQVLGLDVSEKMLAKAQSMTNDDNIIYRQQDLEQLHLPAGSFDLAYSSLTLHYIEHLSELFKTIYEALVSGGQFVFTAEHPIYTASKYQDWTVDSEGQKSWPVNQYQAEGKRITNWFADGVIKQHRMLGTYINMLVQQGFVIQYLNEWGPTAEQIKDCPWLDEEKERPMIFIASVMKPKS